MNEPEYILVDQLGLSVQAVQTEYDNPVYYRYGYLKELNNILKLQEGDPDSNYKKYPLIWVMQPFTIKRGLPALYGRVTDLRIFIINQSDKDLTAEQRMDNNFKPVLYPLYRMLLRAIDQNPAFATQGEWNLSHNLIDRYWIKEIGLDDTTDCIEINNLDLSIHNNFNSQFCSTSNLIT